MVGAAVVTIGAWVALALLVKTDRLPLPHQLGQAMVRTWPLVQRNGPPTLQGAALGIVVGVSVGFGIGFLLCFTSTFTYLVSAYRPIAASSLAGNAFVRSAFAAAFPLFAGQMYERLGTAGATALLAGLMTIAAPLP